VIDLEEVGASAARNIKLSKLDEEENYLVFESSELKMFQESKATRKVLFLTPSQIDLLASMEKFDLFVNHESFAEMYLKTVNSYLGYCKKLTKDHALVYLVNRASRPQESHNPSAKTGLSSITEFRAYDLSFTTPLVQEIDEFRQGFTAHSASPNILFIGRCKLD
jgi:hypothetical protein